MTDANAEPGRLLSQYFGHNSFRGEQLTIIERTLRGGHSLVLMPTGMGKSLCYQIPALVLANNAQEHPTGERPGLTLVISPLIALMKDQVDALVDKGIDATFVNSSLDSRERNLRYEQIGNGQFDLLYVTPERFRKADFLDVLGNRRVHLLAVDEAHCISHWGHDFRPDYTRLAEIRELLGSPTTIALTATATPDVQKDIVVQLGLEPDDIRIFNAGIDRPNLKLNVKPVWGDDEKLSAILDVNHRARGSGIVYFTLIRTLERFSEKLRQCGVGHLSYHGDLPRHHRREVQNAFMSDDFLVLATNAFGMGIDKESIRFVMHAELPGSMESYYQEIGRAGRDGLPSECTLLYDQADLETQMEFLRWSNPDAGFYRRAHDVLVHEFEQVNAFGIEWLAERLNARQRHDRRLETVLGMLDRHAVFEGSLHPLRIDTIGPLPEELASDERLGEKLVRDQRKLLSLVQYANHEGELSDFINEYFGASCGTTKPS